MRQIWIPKIGAPEVLEVREAPDPNPGPGEIRIRVKASGVNFADILARTGLYPDAPKLPTVVGYEVSGVVDATGGGTGSIKEGDRVGSLTRFGGYSDTVVVPAGLANHIPDALSFEKAAAIPVNYLTAWLILVALGNVCEGDTVLVHAAAGGVGQAALQIARWRKAIVIGTASASKHERLRLSGVSHCIDYHREDFESAVKKITKGRGADIVLDAVGGRSFRKSYRCLAPMGRLYLFGVSSFSGGEKRSLLRTLRGLAGLPWFHPIPLMNDNRGVMGVNLGRLWSEGPRLKCMTEEILGLVRQGVLDPVVDRSFSFADAPSAHRHLQSRRNFGKVILVP